MPLSCNLSMINEVFLISHIKEIANKLKNLSWLEEQVSKQNNEFSNWNCLSLADGYPSLLLVFTALDTLFPRECWDQANHLCILKIKEEIERSKMMNCSLFTGLAGVCFGISQASRNRTRYTSMLKTLEQLLISQIEEKIIPVVLESVNSSTPIRPDLYDVISGLAGIGAYALDSLYSIEMRRLLEKILIILIRITENIYIKGHFVPGWYVQKEDLYLEEDKIDYPNGNFNLGLSHGITGILAILSKAKLEGVVVEGQITAINKVAKWLKDKRQQKEGFLYWDTVVSFIEETSLEKEDHDLTQDSWCYGSPGVARTLFQAGKALDNSELMEFAYESYCSIFSRSISSWSLHSPTFCHGISGLLMVTESMYQDTKSLEVKKWRIKILEKLVHFYDSGNLFGYKEVIKYKSINRKEDQFGLLNGVSGIILTLLSAVKGYKGWEIPFLI